MTNIEAMARAITERICRRTAGADEDIAAWVEAHWYIAAADLEAGLIDETGEPLPGYSSERARAAVRDWLSRHPLRSGPSAEAPRRSGRAPGAGR